MALQFQHDFFTGRDEALADIRNCGTWPTTLVSGPSEGMDVHWHSHDVHAYIMEGETDFLDGETGERTPVRAGAKIVVPARTLHAEGPVKDRVVYLIASPDPLDHEEFLRMRSADEL